MDILHALSFVVHLLILTFVQLIMKLMNSFVLLILIMMEEFHTRSFLVLRTREGRAVVATGVMVGAVSVVGVDTMTKRVVDGDVVVVVVACSDGATVLSWTSLRMP